MSDFLVVIFAHEERNTGIYCGMKTYLQFTYIWASNLLANFPIILQLTKRDWSVWDSCALETSGFRIYMTEKKKKCEL